MAKETKENKEAIQAFVYTESHKLVKSYADLMGLDLKEAYKELINKGFDVLCKPFADSARAVMTERQNQDANLKPK